jgi:protein-S-isoprenylcysteine O-methyltransferase Ste14
MESMDLNGIQQLTRHLPDLASPVKRAMLALRFALILGMTTLFFIWTDYLIPDWQPDGEIIVLTLGFLILSFFFSKKALYRQRYGELAFRNAFVNFSVPGLAIIFASVAHVAYMPGVDIPDLWWKPVLGLLGAGFVLVGGCLWLRAVLLFGVDNLTMLYVYFPEEGRMVDSSIYGVIRHPIYAAVLYIVIGLALLSGNWIALVFAALMPLGLTGWVRLVEERDLIERFPDYLNYRRRVPAFWPRPRDLVKFFSFLLRGS